MPKNEIAFTKQALLATKDWDTYQAILHRCLKPLQAKKVVIQTK